MSNDATVTARCNHPEHVGCDDCDPGPSSDRHADPDVQAWLDATEPCEALAREAYLSLGYES